MKARNGAQLQGRFTCLMTPGTFLHQENLNFWWSHLALADDKLLLGCDANAHHTIGWGSSDTNLRANRHCSVVIPFKEEKDKFVVTIKNTVTNLTWDSMRSSTGKPVLVAELGKNSSIHAFTGKADPMGRLWIGTVGPFNKNAQPDLKAGAEYMLTAGGKVVTKISDITTPDGLAWNAEKTIFYFVDAQERKVERFDYGNQSGDISNRKVIFDTKKNNLNGLSTGMTVDTKGKLWIAQFLYGKVIRIDPDSGELLREVSIPAKEVTNVVFGGKNLDVLYVTSAMVFKEVSKPTKYSGRVFEDTCLMNSGKPATGYASQKITAI